MLKQNFFAFARHFVISLIGLSTFACSGGNFFTEALGLAEPKCAVYEAGCKDFPALLLGLLLLSGGERLTIPDALFWLNGRNGFTKNQGAVVWRDSSGNGFDFAGSGVDVSPELLNGHSLLSTQGEGALIRNLEASASGFGADTITIYVVQRQTGTKTNHTLLNWGLTTEQINVHLSFGDTLFFDYGNTAGGGRISVAQPAGWDDAFHLVELHRSGTAGEINVDGLAILAAAFADTLTLNGSNVFYLFANGVEEHKFSGEIAELIVYSRALTDIERSAVRCGLRIKYGLSVAGC